MGQEPTTTTTEGQEPAEGQEPTGTETTETTPASGGSGSDSVETFDAEYVRGLREEAAKHRTDAKAAQDKLKEREDAELSESEKAKKEAKEATERAEKAEAKLLRTEVAAKKKLSPSLAARLIGNTKAELEKDADNLLKEVTPGTGGGFDGGVRANAPKTSSMNDFIRRGRSRGE